PRHGNIKLPPVGVLEQGIKTRPSISPLGAGYTGIGINLDDLPATPLGDLPKLTDLVLYGLPVRADSHIQRRALCHDLVPLHWCCEDRSMPLKINSTLSSLGFSYAAVAGFFVCPPPLG